jgi:hypothetical protein
MSDGADARETLTFVVRLWRESNASGQDHWQGRVEHVASQEVAYVEDAAGQPDAGVLAGGGYILGGGFWRGGEAHPPVYEIYLPVALRRFP